MIIDSLGGYRLVRKLGEGPRAEVYLGVAEREGSQVTPVAIKVFRAHVAHESIITEAEALSRSWGDHVVELLDLATAPDGSPALILGRLGGHSLSRLLADRRTFAAGEAITILAPIAMTLDRMHQAGVVHGAVRADAVLFDATGAPVLACLGRATLVEPSQPPAVLQSHPAIHSELSALGTLAATVLDRVHDDGAALLRDWVGSVAGERHDWLDELVSRLFGLAQALPISMSAPSMLAVESLVPARTVTAEPLPESPAVSALALPEWMKRYVPTGDWVARLTQSLAVVRPRLWIIAGAVGVALVAAVILVPTGQSDATPQPAVSSTPLAPDPVEEGPVTGDDPAAALVALVDTRQRCIRDVSVLCLDAVAQVGSAALAEDQQLVRDIQAGGEAPPTWSITDVTVDERMGGSAIVSVDDPADSEPASFLLVKGEAGWRIRDYLWR